MRILVHNGGFALLSGDGVLLEAGPDSAAVYVGPGHFAVIYARAGRELERLGQMLGVEICRF